MAGTTWNPGDISGFTLSGGNLVATSAVGVNGVRAVDRTISGRFYFEATLTFAGSGNMGFGIANSTANLSNAYTTAANVSYVYNNAGSSCYMNSLTQVGSLGVTLTTGNIVCVALDMVAKRLWYRQAPSGNWNGNVANNPATNTGGFDITALGANIYPGGFSGGSGTRVITANFGDTAFSGAAPAGFSPGFPVGGVGLGGGSTTQARALILA